ncbi:hypothetical protein, partial [Dokdonella immobilis]|uniref:hypothetical protein n=1 Tax=Dokdonella immobilis TaxID=578942 RepID=UPI001C311ED0
KSIARERAPTKSGRPVARASMALDAFLLRCWWRELRMPPLRFRFAEFRCRSGFSRDAFSPTLSNSIEPEGSSYGERARRQTG